MYINIFKCTYTYVCIYTHTFVHISILIFCFMKQNSPEARIFVTQNAQNAKKNCKLLTKCAKGRDYHQTQCAKGKIFD